MMGVKHSIILTALNVLTKRKENTSLQNKYIHCPDQNQKLEVCILVFLLKTYEGPWITFTYIARTDLH